MKKLKVLIVEDEGIVSAGLACYLKGEGHIVEGQAYTGEEALAAVKQTDFDLILMDINLPDINGIRLLQKISEIKNIPCIFVTGYSDKKQIIDANNINTTYGYLIKPVNEKELTAAIEIAINRHEERLKLERTIQKSEKALSDRKTIERAKGLLMDNFGMKETEAMKFLQKKSNDNNKKLNEVAADVLRFFASK